MHSYYVKDLWKLDMENYVNFGLNWIVINEYFQCFDTSKYIMAFVTGIDQLR